MRKNISTLFGAKEIVGCILIIVIYLLCGCSIYHLKYNKPIPESRTNKPISESRKHQYDELKKGEEVYIGTIGSIGLAENGINHIIKLNEYPNETFYIFKDFGTTFYKFGDRVHIGNKVKMYCREKLRKSTTANGKQYRDVNRIINLN